MRIDRIGRYLVASLLALMTVAAHAQSSARPAAPTICPWLTQGTAAKALSTQVSVSVSISDSGQGVCNFSSKEDAATSLKIEVSKTALPSCGPDGMKLRGIGNEAVRCKLAGPPDQTVEMINGRVRDRNFSITIHVRATQSQPQQDPQNDALEQLAELVAGNLF